MDDGLLEELRSVGRSESEGRFTVDLKHALEKLRDFRLVYPHEYILALLSAAVRSGASRFDVRPEPSQLVVEFDGDPFPRAELEGLLSHLLGGSGRPAVLDLATGVHAALALEPVSVEVCSGGHRLAFVGDQERLEEASGPGTRVLLRWRFEARRWLGLVPELALVERRGRCAPLQLQRRGKPLPQEPLEVGPALSVRAVRRRGLLRWSRDYPVREGPYDALLALAAKDAALTVVVAGVSYRLPVEIPGTVAVVVCDDLRLDLTRSGPVEDEEWARVHAFLTRTFAEMVLALPPEVRGGFVAHARQLEEALPEKDPYRRPLLELAADNDDSPELALRLARLYVQVDQPFLARTLFPRALGGMRNTVRGTWAADPTAAEAQIQAAAALAREAFGMDSVEVAEAIAARGEVRALLGRELEAREDAEAALLMAHRLRDRPSGRLGRLFDSLALGLRRDGRVEDALALHREAQLVRSQSADPDRSSSLLYESTALLALAQPEAAFAALTPGFPEVALLDVLAEACLRTDRLADAEKVLTQALAARRWPAVPKPAPEDQAFLALLEELVARLRRPVERSLEGVWNWRRQSMLLPEGPAPVGEFVATAHEYAGYGSLDLALQTLRRAAGRLEAMPDADGRALHRALLFWQVALLRRMGRAAQADLVWTRALLMTAWAPPG